MNNTDQNPTHDDIAALAQEFWEEEGQPEGKAEEHWARAEAQLRKENLTQTSTTKTTRK